MSLSRTSPSRGHGSPDVIGFYDDDTGSIQYLVTDPGSGKSALIDVVLGFDPAGARTDPESADAILRYVESEKLEVVWVLDTHPHADHLMASSYLAERLGAPNAIGEKVAEIAELWRDYYNMPDAFDPQRDFSRLFADGDTFEIGDLTAKVMLTPGHTLGSVTYVIGDDAAFVNDTFMQPDVGTSRADFPGGSSSELFDSLERILELPDETRLFIGHDYGTDHRTQPAWESTVLEQRRHNTHIGGGREKQDYVKLRDERDATLALPDRMLQVLQLNLRAGRLPDIEDDGNRYLKIPINRL